MSSAASARAKGPVVHYIGQSWLTSNSSLSIASAMPSSTIGFLQSCLLLWSTLSPWGLSAPTGGLTDCPGYTASNVKKTDSGITADLKLSGPECNVHGQDLHDLKFLVEYQTGTSRLYSLPALSSHVVLSPELESISNVGLGDCDPFELAFQEASIQRHLLLEIDFWKLRDEPIGNSRHMLTYFRFSRPCNGLRQRGAGLPGP